VTLEINTQNKRYRYNVVRRKRRPDPDEGKEWDGYKILTCPFCGVKWRCRDRALWELNKASLVWCRVSKCWQKEGAEKNK